MCARKSKVAVGAGDADDSRGGTLGEFSITHWLILGMVLLLLFGAKRIPEVGSSLGKGIREFKRSLSDVGDAVNDKETRALPPTSGTAATRDNNPPKRLLE